MKGDGASDSIDGKGDHVNEPIPSRRARPDGMEDVHPDEVYQVDFSKLNPNRFLRNLGIDTDGDEIEKDEAEMDEDLVDDEGEKTIVDPFVDTIDELKNQVTLMRQYIMDVMIDDPSCVLPADVNEGLIKIKYEKFPEVELLAHVFNNIQARLKGLESMYINNEVSQYKYSLFREILVSKLLYLLKRIFLFIY